MGELTYNTLQSAAALFKWIFCIDLVPGVDFREPRIDESAGGIVLIMDIGGFNWTLRVPVSPHEASSKSAFKESQAAKAFEAVLKVVVEAKAAEREAVRKELLGEINERLKFCERVLGRASLVTDNGSTIPPPP